MAPEAAKRWMQTHRNIFGNRPISDICFPGSHDAGMYRLGYHTTFGTESNVLTQTRSIFDQLEFGVRYLDIRPTFTSEGLQSPVHLACGHYTGEGEDKIGWQGGDGVLIKEMVDDLNRFTRDNAELVILEIKNINRIIIDNPISSTQRGLNPDEWNTLFDALAKIENLFTITQSDGKDKQLQDYDLNRFVGNDHAAVIVLVDGYGQHDVLFQRGFWPLKMSNDQVYLYLKEESVTRMQGSDEAILSSLNPLQLLSANWNALSVLSLAKQVQDEQFPWLLQQLAHKGYPAKINMDRIQNADLLTFCLAISYQRYNQAKGLNNMVIVYGGCLITHQDAHNAIRLEINNGKRFTVTNSNLRSDPWPNMTKSCAVFYEQDGLIKGRFAQEGLSLHVEQDVISIKYGPKQIHDQVMYFRLLQAIALRHPFSVSNDNLGGDPQPGVYKTCAVRFRDENGDDIREEKAGEGKVLDFETFWEKVGKGISGGRRW